MSNLSVLAAYVRQQKELAMPDFVFGRDFNLRLHLRAVLPPSPPEELAPSGSARRGSGPRAADAQASGGKAPRATPFSRLRKLTPVSAVSPRVSAAPRPASPDLSPRSLTYERKRSLLKELYTAQCDACRLAATRKSFVFGSGNVDAALMIVGEAPGDEEDLRGLPIVGPAGSLLDELLRAIGLERKKDVFITDVLKCKPPEKPNPESVEVQTCLPLLDKQISIITPKLLLFLGDIPARALLGITGAMEESRGLWRSYKSIPALVTYHPAEVLEHGEYRRFVDEDFRSVSQRLKGKG